MSSARKMHVGIIGSGRSKRMIDPLAGLPRLHHSLVASDAFTGRCPCGDALAMQTDRDGLTWVECRSCGASNHDRRRAAID